MIEMRMGKKDRDGLISYIRCVDDTRSGIKKYSTVITFYENA